MSMEGWEEIYKASAIGSFILSQETRFGGFGDGINVKALDFPLFLILRERVK